MLSTWENFNLIILFLLFNDTTLHMCIFIQSEALELFNVNIQLFKKKTLIITTNMGKIIKIIVFNVVF